MIVCKAFPGDDNEVLKWVQHDLYPSLVVFLFYYPAQRYIESARFLQLDSESVERINSMKGFDHRVLQDAHDIIAAYFRFTFDQASKVSLPVVELEYKESLKENWLKFFHRTSQELAKNDMVARTILQVVLNENSQIGYAAEETLGKLLLGHFPIPGFFRKTGNNGIA